MSQEEETQEEPQEEKSNVAEAQELAERLQKATKDAPQVRSIVEEAKSVAERIERANAHTRELIRRQEELAVEQTLAGKTIVQQEKPKEETPEEYAKKVLSGQI